MNIKFKILIGLGAAVIAWYILRELLISLNRYIEGSNFGKKRIAKKKKSKFKFKDPLAPRK